MIASPAEAIPTSKPPHPTLRTHPRIDTYVSYRRRERNDFLHATDDFFGTHRRTRSTSTVEVLGSHPSIVDRERDAHARRVECLASGRGADELGDEREVQSAGDDGEGVEDFVVAEDAGDGVGAAEGVGEGADAVGDAAAEEQGEAGG